MSWDDLAWRGLVVRPWDTTQPKCALRRSQFKAPLSKTLRLLARELDFLGATKLVILLDVREQDIRLDGNPRANARVGNPCVAVSFESREHGPLRYATGEYDDWKDNLRAIALSLEALRAVNRYGVANSGEQYRGWRAIPKSTDPADSIQTEEQAQAFIEEQHGGSIRDALFATHPDHGGDVDEFRKVVRAKELLPG